MEYDEQIDFIAWFKDKYPHILIYMIPNEYVHISHLKYFRLEGGRAGMPDLHIPEWNMWIEMKRITGELSAKQKCVINELKRIGHVVIVGYGCKDAIEKITAFKHETDN